MQSDVLKMMSDGAEYMKAALEPFGFKFRILKTGNSSGGKFCEAKFTRDNRRIELHFRWSLGLVRYHYGNINASHESYIEALGMQNKSQFPGFYEDELEGFQKLAQDIDLIRSDFIEGDCNILHKAAETGARRDAEKYQQNMIGYVGDTRARSQAREAFREKRYTDVVNLLGGLHYPDDLSKAEQRMYEIARQRKKPG